MVGVLSTVSLGERAQAVGVLKVAPLRASFISYFEIGSYSVAQAPLGLCPPTSDSRVLGLCTWTTEDLVSVILMSQESIVF